MPYVLRKEATGEIAACIQRNVYDFEYYGVKWWENPNQADQEKTAWLQQNGFKDADEWAVHQVEESTLKLGNVKLKNDAGLRLFMDEQSKLTARS